MSWHRFVSFFLPPRSIQRTDGGTQRWKGSSLFRSSLLLAFRGWIILGKTLIYQCQGGLVITCGNIKKTKPDHSVSGVKSKAKEDKAHTGCSKQLQIPAWARGGSCVGREPRAALQCQNTFLSSGNPPNTAVLSAGIEGWVKTTRAGGHSTGQHPASCSALWEPLHKDSKEPTLTKAWRSFQHVGALL